MKRLITKADRQAVQDANFEHLITTGYAKEIYSGLTIFTKDENDRFYLKVFRDTVSSPIYNYYHRTNESRTTAIDEQKKNYDRQTEWKAERRAKKRNPETSCSGSIKKELIENFPGIKFSVTSSGSSVRVHWTDGPTRDQVEEFTSKYQMGHFDGMTEMYEYSNRRDDIPQTNYVMESRDMSPETREVLTKEAQILIDAGNDYSGSGCHDAGNFAYRLFQACPIPTGAKVTGIERNDTTCGLSDPCTFFRVVVELHEGQKTESKTTQTNFEIIPMTAGQINVVDYSEKAFAVIGDTKSTKDILKELGGKFNPRLTCGAGWIFSKKRLQSVQSRLEQIAEERKHKPFMALLPPAKAEEVRTEWNKTEEFLKNLSA